MEQNTFLEERLELIYIQEGFEDIIQKFKVPLRLKSIESAIKTKKSSNIVKALKFLPVLKIGTIKKIGKKKVKNFDKYYMESNRKFSSDVPSNEREVASVSLAVIKASRDELKSAGKDVSKLDKIMAQIKQPFYKKYEEELFAATLLGVLVGVFALVFTYIIPQIISIAIWSGGIVVVLLMLGILISGIVAGLKG